MSKNKTISVRLSEEEMLYAASIGCRRHISAIHRKYGHGYSGGGWSIHVEGACGELAFANAIGVKWDATVDTFKTGGDVGHIQVRTRTKHIWDLIIRDDDRDSDVFVLVTREAREFIIQGWILCFIAKQMADCRKSHGRREEAWFIPSCRLSSIFDFYGT